MKDFAKIFRALLFRALLITASVIYFYTLNIMLVCRIWHKCMLNIWNLNFFRCITLIFVEEPYTNVSEIIIYKKITYYFEEMFLKDLAMQFLEEYFLVVFWCTTISFFLFFLFFAKVSENLGDVSTLSKGIQPHLTKLLYQICLSGKLNSKKSNFSLFLLISRIVYVSLYLQALLGLFWEFAGKSQN